MPLTGEYEPSTSERTRRQVELFERSNGTEGTTLRGMPVDADACQSRIPAT